MEKLVGAVLGTLVLLLCGIACLIGMFLMVSVATGIVWGMHKTWVEIFKLIGWA